MLFFIFQLLDLFTALVLLAATLGLGNWQVFLYHGSYLIAKGAYYWRDPLSWIDIIIGLYLLMMIFGARGWFAYAAAVYFLYKFFSYMIWS